MLFIPFNLFKKSYTLKKKEAMYPVAGKNKYKTGFVKFRKFNCVISNSFLQFIKSCVKRRQSLVLFKE